MNVQVLMDYLFSRRAPNLPHEALAEVFDRLIWCMEDNGEDIIQVQRNWLKSDDPEKVGIALCMSTAFPYSDANETGAEIASLRKKHPQLSELCDHFLANFRKL